MKNFIIKTFALFLMALLILLSYTTIQPTSSNPSNLSATGFSTERAFQHVEEMASKPHAIGTRAHSEVRNYILGELQEMGLEIQTQKGYDLNNSGVLTVPENIVAKLEGSDPKPKSDLLILSHYDSAVHSSYGASDDASGVATILEALRIFIKNNTEHTNDIIVCFTDAEEVGLNGAHLFVKQHPWAKDIGFVINFEARGTSGPSNTIIETNGGNQKLVEAFTEADPTYPLASSLMYSIYKILPNDTDATIFREEKDIPSFFFAFIDGHYNYHTANDIPKNLSKTSLAHQATYLMAMLPHFSNIDLTTLNSEKDSVYFNFPIFKIVSYSFGWIYPMLGLAWLLFGLLIVYGFHKKRIDKKTVKKGIAAFLITFLASIIIAFFGWKLILAINPQYLEIQQGFPYNGHQYIAAFVLLTLSILLFTYHKFFEWENAPGLMLAPLFFWLLIHTGIAIFFKGAAYFIIPFFFALLSLFIMLKLHKPGVYFMLALAIPALFIFSPLVQFFPVGLGLKMLSVSAVLIVLLFGLLIPFFGYFKNKKWMSLLAFLGAIAFFINAQNNSNFSEENKKPNSLVYLLDVDSQTATWNTYDSLLDDWTKNYITENKEIATSAVFDNKYNANFTHSNKALLKAIPAADLFVEIDSSNSATNQYSIKIAPLREINRMEIFSTENTNFQNFTVNGIEMKEKPSLSKSHTQEKNNQQKLLTYYAIDQDTLALKFTLKKSEHPTLQLFEASHDIFQNPWIEVPQRKKNMMPRPFVLNDAIITKQNIPL